MTISNKYILAILAALSFVVSGAAALAAPANATVALNVRTGPGTNFNVIDTLLPGQAVDVTECVSNGWCHITQDGPNGWVSSTYLSAGGSSGGSGGGSSGGSGGGSGSGGSSSDPDCSFGIVVGPDGPQFSLTCGDAPAPPPPPPAPEPDPDPVGNTACFYTGSNFSGAEFCHGPATLNTLDGVFNDRISSVQLFGNAKVKLCRNANLSGTCRNYNNSRANLPPIINNRASSLAVFTGAAPGGGGGVILPVPPILPLAPVTHSTGPINLQQTFRANLDNGNVGNAGADIWYQAINPIQKFITPRNGAKLALGDGTNRGFAGCSTASYSGNRISIWAMPAGTYVCVRTSQNRISQFRLNGYTGTTMNLGYTTWAN